MNCLTRDIGPEAAVSDCGKCTGLVSRHSFYARFHDREQHGILCFINNNKFSDTRGLRSHIVPAVLLITPVLLQALLVLPRFLNWRPVWAWYPDPGYQYLWAGGSLINGGTTDLIFHPGTSFQWLIGASQVITNLVAGQDSLMLDVASRPEFYSQTACLSLAIAYIVALGFASWRMFRHLGLWPTVTFQLLLLWGLPLLTFGRFVLWPESLVLTLTVASIAIIAPQLGGKIPLHPRAQAVALGIIAAVGMTAKVTYLPIVILIVITLGWRRIALFMVPLVSAALLLMIPVYSRLDDMYRWFLGITIEPGRHGQTGSWEPLNNFIDSAFLLNIYVRWFIPVFLVVVAGSIFTRIFPRRATRKELIPVAALLLAAGAVLLSGLKDSELRDFILVIPLVAALAALTLNSALETLRGYVRVGALVAVLLVGSFLAAHGIVQEHNFYQGYSIRLSEIVRDAKTIDRMNKAGSWATGYNAWTRDSSRVFGLLWSAGSFKAQVREVNPNALHFDLFSREIVHVALDNTLVPLSCEEMEERISYKGLGIIVESQGHLQFSDNDTRIDLNNATAGYEGPQPLGRYFAYPLTDIDCKR